MPRMARNAILIACIATLAACSPASSAPATPATSVSPSAAGEAASLPAETPEPLTETALTDLIDPDALREHLEAFAGIADASGGSRATGTLGFDGSVEHVAATLEAAGYTVERQAFDAEGVPSVNLLAERTGTGDGLFILGAHLDSVSAGTGINDNGSGVAALLVIAEALTHVAPPVATIRFAFWGAEEGGPFGSAAYVAALDEAPFGEVDGYLNFDMLGSTNGLTFVYDEAGAAPGSEALTTVVASPFTRRGLPWEPIDLTGHADHGPFTAAGIPTGGLFAGGREPVTDAQAARHGATPGQPADPCSHLACDTLTNVDLARLARMTDAIAAIVVALAAPISRCGCPWSAPAAREPGRRGSRRRSGAGSRRWLTEGERAAGRHSRIRVGFESPRSASRRRTPRRPWRRARH
jgi:aminopeptidase S